MMLCYAMVHFFAFPRVFEELMAEAFIAKLSKATTASR